MITKAKDDIPEIEWDRGELIDRHDQLTEFGALGISDDGRIWIGTWIEIHGEFEEITNIEEDRI